MNYLDWYTDAVDVYRVVPMLEGKLTRNERRQVLADVPCRLYRSDASAITMDPGGGSPGAEEQSDVQHPCGHSGLCRRAKRLP